MPPALEHLDCSLNQITTLPSLPNSLEILFCENNQISTLPNLPNSINDLRCSNNQITFLPSLPDSLMVLNCFNNQISSLPSLPNNLTSLCCSNNQISFLPSLPNSIVRLECGNNQIYNLPNLPNNLLGLLCNNNFISCFPTFPNPLGGYILFDISSNLFSCLPNYVQSMDSLTISYPLCVENDFVNNPSGCNPAKGILGSIYSDLNLNCIVDNSENLFVNFSVELYNSTDSLIRQTYTLSNGIYQFPEELGTYKVKIDTFNLPFTVQCQNLDTIVIIDSQNPSIDSVNFALICKQGFDLGVQSALNVGWVFPGQNHDLTILAGDMSQWYNMNCASGISGAVEISVSGPVTFQNASIGALIPVVSGNTFTYDISDFGNVDVESAFGLIFQTDTTAQGGDEICVSISVTPTNGDNNMTNNTFDYCYNVVNSYDPNMKEVYPVNVVPGYADYFTYTIHFQNTGSAPAFNIRLLDTLDANLDLETFQVTNYSHYNSTMLKNDILTFHFPNIMLADSTSDMEGSKGFVQYRIKPKANLALGTQIKNTANIYFDFNFNAPIVTNTTVNEYVETNSLSEKENRLMNIFPNPFSSSTTVVFKNSIKNAELTLYNVYGQKVRTISDFSGNKLKLERENLSNGIYYLNVINEINQTETIKLIIAD